MKIEYRVYFDNVEEVSGYYTAQRAAFELWVEVHNCKNMENILKIKNKERQYHFANFSITKARIFMIL